uniref:Uncharacterized protein n=1 Tax=Davidia involucrata TaxID=16924 RepID=A0A5B7A1Q0_DAVIN
MAPSTRHRSRGAKRPRGAQSEPLPTPVSTPISAEASSVASTISRKGLGKSKNLALQNAIKQNGGNRIKIEIPPHLMMPVGEYHQLFKTELGIICRMHAPYMTATCWDEVTPEDLQRWHDRIQDLFEIHLTDAHTLYAVNYFLMMHFKGYRYALYQHYVKTPDATRHPYPDVKQEEWDILCARWASQEYQAVSEQTSIARSQQTVSHCAGSMSFAQHRHVLSQGSATPPSLIDVWHSTHYKGSTWTDEIAHQKYDVMVLMQDEPNLEGSTPLTDDEIFERVMGNRSGYALGLGHGVVPPLSRSASHMSCEARVHEADLRAAASAAQAE